MVKVCFTRCLCTKLAHCGFPASDPCHSTMSSLTLSLTCCFLTQPLVTFVFYFETGMFEGAKIKC